MTNICLMTDVITHIGTHTRYTGTHTNINLDTAATTRAHTTRAHRIAHAGPMHIVTQRCQRHQWMGAIATVFATMKPQSLEIVVTELIQGHEETFWTHIQVGEIALCGIDMRLMFEIRLEEAGAALVAQICNATNMSVHELLRAVRVLFHQVAGSHVAPEADDVVAAEGLDVDGLNGDVGGEGHL